MNEKTMTRRNFQYHAAAALCGLLSVDVEAVPSSEIPVAKALHSEIAAALKIPSPLVVFVSLDNCPFCKIAKNNYLVPLMNEQAVPIVQVNFRYANPVVDWQGKTKSQDQLIRAWGVKVAPTVLFIGKDGKEVAPRLVGSATSDFYGSYLDERLRLSLATIARDSGLK
jgi:thioredoxin-related protein